VRRIALTDEDAAGRDLVLGWARDAGCEIRIDAVGNAFAQLAGTDPGRRAVMIGSHLDTQPSGGRFDGALGVLCGVEILRTIRERGVEHRAPIELAIWTDEEGARFDVSCIGSSVFAGRLSLDAAYRLTGADGVSVREALERLDWVGSAEVGRPLPDCYFELHIEQGPILERRGLVVAVVTGVIGIRWIEVEVVGAEAHAGTTPYEARRDALLRAARLTVDVEQIASRRAPDARASVCMFSVEPNAGSVIPGRARLLVDLRHPDARALDEMNDELSELVAGIERDGFRTALRTTWSAPPVEFDPGCVCLLREGIASLGLPVAEMLSGAGHDAGYMAMVVPSAMLFIPCRNGISHNPREFAEREHAQLAADALLHAVLARANASSTDTWG
jgi:beta-ureidopropionase / N-carbamoyl-L-amino-acid hydrolase